MKHLGTTRTTRDLPAANRKTSMKRHPRRDADN
jgi:hypothetical protein